MAGHNGPICDKECSDCKQSIKIKLYQFNHNVKKNGRFVCRNCALKLAGKRGSYDRSKTRDLSKDASNLWAGNEYRQKVAAGVSATWTTEKRTRASEELKTKWALESYRRRMTKMAVDQWNDPSYLAARLSGDHSPSRPQLALYRLLDEQHIDYHKEGQDTKIGPWLFDCRIPYPTNKTRSLLIEVQSYFHTLPKQMARDSSKFTYIARYFPEYDIMYVWDHEFSVKDKTVDRILSKLGVPLNTIDFQFSDLQLKTPTSKELREFLDIYHYLGRGRYGQTIGAYHNGTLIAVSVLSKPVRANLNKTFGDDFCELSRFCIHPSYHKKNFASWLISKTIKTATTKVIVAYADTTIQHVGTIYKAANFTFHHEVPADYWYVDTDGFVMRKKCLYERAKKLHLTENQFATQFGFSKRFGGNKLCFVYPK